ncbi:MAG: hypothetical protein DBP01_01265, partial [gamma proteobacterium symbiont of Ctena orbiculata]
HHKQASDKRLDAVINHSSHKHISLIEKWFFWECANFNPALYPFFYQYFIFAFCKEYAEKTNRQ